jgi:hypothetical protein
MAKMKISSTISCGRLFKFKVNVGIGVDVWEHGSRRKVGVCVCGTGSEGTGLGGIRVVDVFGRLGRVDFDLVRLWPSVLAKK